MYFSASASARLCAGRAVSVSVIVSTRVHSSPFQFPSLRPRLLHLTFYLRPSFAPCAPASLSPDPDPVSSRGTGTQSRTGPGEKGGGPANDTPVTTGLECAGTGETRLLGRRADGFESRSPPAKVLPICGSFPNAAEWMSPAPPAEGRVGRPFVRVCSCFGTL